ncbi:sodium/hydrogen exchanger [Thecamonas trahens ATCC 50062]|uniref:Sodium/hydrogen exchanger n=1 Tax=Thecamonas trahens ATCC 50062 TaxID=461836 RepID=A0A0L0D896_THETB|nr:sodium/hydrogen exchanger [Thecamonas trahens ATCC 50062]KNC47533.1 sodium/hydrogen exchanger [Thecamonas trahens ATCC 50062]|eukprot:XP_013759465.1 sodium/hydrogen exchanger [Thecamonas trahens ATCC 50062]
MSALRWLCMLAAAGAILAHVTNAACAPDDEECEERESWGLLIILGFLFVAIWTTYGLVSRHLHYLPESIAVIIFGAIIGIIIRLSSSSNDIVNFEPDTFFLFLLPPIIFESGYSLHKGNFFRNIGSILTFAIAGTLISTLLFGLFLFMLGYIGWVYYLPLSDALVYGALISAVDPVATLAVFQALDVDPTLSMLVFGESVLNDAVAIVLYHSILDMVQPDAAFTLWTAMGAMARFLFVSLGSVTIGVGVALVSAVLFKYTDIRRYQSLELSLVFVFCWLPYLMAEGLRLSGIMAILFAGIVMAHYTYFNLSPTTQITTQKVFRAVAWLAETCIFGYLGIAVFSFDHYLHFGLIFWSIVLILVGRAANIFPLSSLVNARRAIQITPKHQVIMWFSGLRGAIAFALALKLPLASRTILVTTTLVIVLFTILVLGGGTLPLLKLMRMQTTGGYVSMSKTEELDPTVSINDAEEDASANSASSPHRSRTIHAEPGSLDLSRSWFERIDDKYLKPFFRDIYSRRAARQAQIELEEMTQTWYSNLKDTLAPTDAADGHLAAFSAYSLTDDEADDDLEPVDSDIAALLPSARHSSTAGGVGRGPSSDAL